MGKLGKYRDISIYDFPDCISAEWESKMSSHFTAYWISDSEGVILWRGQKVADIKYDEQVGFSVLNFDEEVFNPKEEIKEKPKHEKVAWEIRYYNKL